MTPFIRRNLLIPLSTVLFGGLLYSLVYLVPLLNRRIQHLELIFIACLMLMAMVVMLFWVSLGVFAGLTSFLLAMIFIYKPLTALNPYYYGVLILAFFLNSIIGHHIYRKVNKSVQDYTITAEKVNEDINLIQNHFENRMAEISAMEGKINSLFKLKDISEKLSLSFSAEEVIKVTVNETFDNFKGDVRVSFYTADEKRKELFLSSTAMSDTRKPVAPGKGGIFERWIMTKMQGLLVRDTRKDFRFSVTGREKNADFISLIGKPLIIGGSVTGILEVDSRQEEAFGQHELRILDIIGELAAIALENAKLYRKTEELAIRDSLTGLYVHRFFMERLEEEIRRGLRSGSTFALFMLDIDDFKKFNDKHGHMAGDLVLKNVGRILKSKASAGDIVCRYGGEEFTFIALNCNKEGAVKLARDIKDEIENSCVNIRRERKSVTVSIGLAMFPANAKLRDGLIWEADRRLYQAKAKGKNRICSK
ncbi:MAG: diguanylate cyclase [Candidatus Omnitrophica bacterium]|nr:diguanylate cyclase [Candidatus Omnitrophota bacterium]